MKIINGIKNPRIILKFLDNYITKTLKKYHSYVIQKKRNSIFQKWIESQYKLISIPTYMITQDFMKLEKNREKITNQLTNPIYFNQIQNESENIMKGRFSIFEKKNINLQNIRWNYSFFENIEWPLNEALNMKLTSDSFGPELQIDIKYVWELNRFSYLPSLGICYYCSKNEEIVDHIIYLFHEWIEQNPIGFGVNWVSGLEIAHRLVNWMITLQFIKTSVRMDLVQWNIIMNSIMGQYLYLKKVLFSPETFNHSLGEAFGIYFIAYLFKSDPFFKKDYSFFKSFLKKQLSRQILSDGMNVEMTSNYHRYTAEFFILFYWLDGESFSINEKEILLNYCKTLCYFLSPSLESINIGDLDNASIIPNCFFFQKKEISLLSFCSRLLNFELPFELPKQECMNLLEFFIPNNITFESSTHKFSQNILFDKAHYLFHRNAWSKNGSFLFFDMGPFFLPIGAHDHSDIGNLILFIEGEPILSDPGVYRYNIPLPKRFEERSALNHNVLSIGNQDQAKQIEFFQWTNIPKLEHSILNISNSLYYSVTHNGFLGFFTKREICFNSDLSKIIIIDSLKMTNDSPKKIPQIIVSFHFHPKTQIQSNSVGLLINNKIRIVGESDYKYRINLINYPFSKEYGFQENAINAQFVFDIEKKEKEDIIIARFLIES